MQVGREKACSSFYPIVWKSSKKGAVPEGEWGDNVTAYVFVLKGGSFLSYQDKGSHFGVGVIRVKMASCVMKINANKMRKTSFEFGHYACFVKSFHSMKNLPQKERDCIFFYGRKASCIRSSCFLFPLFFVMLLLMKHSCVGVFFWSSKQTIIFMLLSFRLSMNPQGMSRLRRACLALREYFWGAAFWYILLYIGHIHFP